MKKALIVGNGKSGKSASKFLKKLGYMTYITDDDQKNSNKLFKRDRFMSSLSLVVLSPGIAPDHPAIKRAKEFGIDHEINIIIFVIPLLYGQSEAMVAQFCVHGPSIRAGQYYRLLTGVILHDIGKCKELSGPVITEYTVEGKLLGHISIMNTIVKETANKLGYDNERVMLLQHMILSHHGQLEYGSPKEPATPEAALIHFLDYNDSRLAGLETEVSKTDKGEYTQPLVSFDRRSFYIPNIETKN